MATDREESVVRRTVTIGMLLCAIASASVLRAQDPAPGVVARNDSVSIRLVDVDLRSAVQVLGKYLDRPVVFGTVNGVRVTLETPQPVPIADVGRLLRGLLESQNYELFADTATAIYRVRPRETARQLGGPPLMDPRGVPPMGGNEALQLYVIHLRHARADDVAATVNALYGRSSSLGESGARRTGTLRIELQENRVPPTLGIPSTPEVVTSVAGRSATFSGEVTIVPDPRANSLLIRAAEKDFELLKAAVRELDIRPLQVLITVTIAEIRKDRSLSFGVSATAGHTSIGKENATVGGTVTGGGVSDVVIDFLNVGAHDIDIRLRAAAARGDVRILSRPVVIAANNEDAEINVGSQRPFVQVARVLPTENTARDQVVQYKDVGTRLSVRPTISPDGYVMLQVTQEVNQATGESSGLSGVDAPVISTRSVQTQLLIKDRQTVVLGGLTDKQRDVSQGGVPVLSSIPVLGGLFGRRSRRTVETELYLFITPHVIRDDAEAEAATKPLETRANEVKP